MGRSELVSQQQEPPPTTTKAKDKWRRHASSQSASQLKPKPSVANFCKFFLINYNKNYCCQAIHVRLNLFSFLMSLGSCNNCLDVDVVLLFSFQRFTITNHCFLSIKDNEPVDRSKFLLSTWSMIILIPNSK